MKIILFFFFFVIKPVFYHQKCLAISKNVRKKIKLKHKIIWWKWWKVLKQCDYKAKQLWFQKIFNEIKCSETKS